MVLDKESGVLLEQSLSDTYTGMDEFADCKPSVRHVVSRGLMGPGIITLGNRTIKNCTGFATGMAVDDLICQTTLCLTDSENEIEFDPSKSIVTIYCPEHESWDYTLGRNTPISWEEPGLFTEPMFGMLTFRPDYESGRGYAIFDESGKVVGLIYSAHFDACVDDLELHSYITLVAPPGKPAFYKSNPHPLFPQSAKAELLVVSLPFKIGAIEYAK